jgi:membrane-bound lytic murein transglycosylase A
VPIYRVPSDLVRCTQPNGAPGRRIDQTGTCTLYFTRAEIEDGALANRGLEIAWVADPVELFFLEIQGSGRLRSPEGEVMRLGYAGQNGRDYVALGQVMRQRGLIGDATGYPTSMQGIKGYLRDHPGEARALMDANLSYIFFQDVRGDGPVGSLGVPVRAQSSVAADPNFVPLGAPIWLAADRAELNGLWIAQDVGGAIKGANRFDSFWGAGDQAAATAGGMRGTGQALVLLPKGTLARLGVQ